MDAILEEKLSVDDFWQAYVGDISPLEFMNRMYSPEIDACVEAYVNALPDLFGIVRRQTWKASFEAPTQFRRGEIAAAIAEKLEKSEAEWRPHLNQREAPPEPAAPAPEPVQHEASPQPGESVAHADYDPESAPDSQPEPDLTQPTQAEAAADETEAGPTPNIESPQDSAPAEESQA